MKNSIVAAYLLFSACSLAEIETISGFNGQFDLSFINEGDVIQAGSSKSTGAKNWTKEQKGIVCAALNYWDSIIANKPGRNISIAVLWTNHPASGSHINMRKAPYKGEIPGVTNYAETYAESIWRGGYSGAKAEGFDYDIILEFGGKIDWSFSLEKGKTGEKQFDFYSAVAHELGHQFGFGTGARIGQVVNGQYFNFVYESYTAFDLLARTGHKPMKFDVPPTGQKEIYLGESALKLDTTLLLGRGFVHVSNATGQMEPQNMMFYKQLNGPNFEMRVLSSEELKLMKEMGWTIENK